MMRSWTGILCLTSDPYGLRALIGHLSLPSSVKGGSWVRVSLTCSSPLFVVRFMLVLVAVGFVWSITVQEAIFDLLFHILDVVKNPELGLGEIGRERHPNLLLNYMVMVLLAFIDANLVEV